MSLTTLVRRDLKDEDSSNYRWQDNEIERAMGRAVAELSRSIPQEMKSTLDTVDASPDIDISTLTDRISIDRVEFPISQTPRQFQRFTVYQDTLTMISGVVGDGNEANVYWSALHTLDASTSTIPAYLEDVLALGAAAYAVLAQAQYRTDTDGFGGQKADTDYQAWGRAMLKEFRDLLKRFGRDRKLRIGRLYQADDGE